MTWSTVRNILVNMLRNQMVNRDRNLHTKPFADRSQRNGVLSFVKSLLYDQDWFESLWRAKSKIQEKPFLFIWGMKDKIITPKYLEKFKSGFSNSEVVVFETAGHFPQEVEGLRVGQKIGEFIKQNS